MRGLLLMIVISICVTATSQEVLTRANGEKIIVNNDGSWNKANIILEVTESDTKGVINTTDLAEVVIEVEREIDEFNGSSIYQTELWTYIGAGESKGTNFSLYTKKVDNLYALYIQFSRNIGCLTRDSSFLIKLSNNEIVKLRYIGDINCSTPAGGLFTFGPAPSLETITSIDSHEKDILRDINLLKKYDWKSIRIQGSKYYYDLKPKPSRKIPNPEQSFRAHLRALDNG